MSFVYALVDPRSSEIRYVGGTTGTLLSRLSTHISNSRNEPTHKGNWIQSLIIGGVEPEIHCLEKCEGHFNVAEIRWIEFLKSIGTRLTNANNGGGGNCGWVASEDTRMRMSEARKSWSHSEETKAKMNLDKKGKPFSEDHKRKLSESAKLRPHRPYPTEEQRARMSAAHTGTEASEETKRKMSVVHMWHTNTSPKQRELLAEANRTRIHTAESRAKQSSSKKGIPLSEQHKAKIGAAGKASWERRKRVTDVAA